MGRPRLALKDTDPGYGIRLSHEYIFPRCPTSGPGPDQSAIYSALFPQFFQLVTISEGSGHAHQPTPGQLSSKAISGADAKIELHRETPTSEELRGATIGHFFSDGSSVLYREHDRALLVAPPETEVICSHSQKFTQVFKNLIENGFDPNQWYVPNLLQLRLAFQTYKKFFSHEAYWCATELPGIRGYSFAINFDDKTKDPFIHTMDNRFSLRVRAFREISIP